ncbi:arginine--tRNA ligase [Calditrichota bacterium]
MIRAEEYIREKLEQICAELGYAPGAIMLEIPRQKGHGDLSCNVAMTLAKAAGEPPRQIAARIIADYSFPDEVVASTEIAGPGFLNFSLSNDYLFELLKAVIEAPDQFGAIEPPADGGVIFEFVSSNPTGPLNIVSARAASVGSTLVKVFRKRGIRAWSEYYVNDGGKQVRLFGESVLARMKGNELPEGGYQGDYVQEIADILEVDEWGIDLANESEVGKWSADRMRENQEGVLGRFGVSFDRWFRESELYADDSAEAIVASLKAKDCTYEKDGALFFRATDFGDNNDRVLTTSDGRLTYIVPDVAYHIDKHSRGFETACTILGPDHHGQSISMKAALKAMGLPDEFYKPLIIQQVNLKRDGVEVKMSKRAGQMVTLEELIEEVGVDAARYFFLMRKTTSPLDFDIELAKRHSNDNPVFYVQYAHARIKSILRQPGASELEMASDLTVLTAQEELDLMRMMSQYPWTLDAIVRSYEPHALTVYLTDLAKAFHQFYTVHRVITDDKKSTEARLMLCKGVANLIAQGLDLMGVDAPEKM